MPKKKLTVDQLRKIEERAFSRKVLTTFKNAGFEYLPTRDQERYFGSKKGELDFVFLYENILLVCEDTISASSNVKDHLKNKKLLFDQIAANKQDLVDWLKEKHADKFAKFDEYDTARYKIFFLYFTKNKSNLTPEDEELFAPVKVVENSTLNYFQKITRNIRFSAKPEIYRYLEINSRDIGTIRSSSSKDEIRATIISPSDNTGLKNGVRLVSFMMCAETLIKNCYVLRKDNWENSIELYQRLIERNRIQSIRKYLATKESTFFNNIIVSLPNGVSFQDAENNQISLENIQDFDGKHTMLIPNEFNSICVIDGQHRIFAHFEGEDSYEAKISQLRKKLHLLVTGLIFPPDMSKRERTKYESEIFLDINSNAKPVPPDVLLHIETLKDPYSDLGVARQVLEKLNKRNVFINYFQLSLMETAPIKIASIIKFALRGLVEITEDTSKETLYNFWTGDTERKLVDKKDDKLLDDYVDFVVGVLDVYFSALKSNYNSVWNDADSKILSITSINGFIIALKRTLPIIGVKDRDYYTNAFGNLGVDFAKANFRFASSQYNMFSKVILRECFKIVEDGKGGWQQIP